MANNLQYKVEVDGEQAKGAVKSFREQLREASKDVINLSEKFGATSIEAVNAAKKVAILRDTIGDAKSLADAFNPDAKFKAVTSSLSGIAGGFGAVQGAMALFGVESDNVQKTLLKVQSAMAISQGLQSVGEAVDSFKQLGAVIKSTTIFQGAYNFVMGQSSEVIKVANVELSTNIVELNTQSAATSVVATTTSAATIALRVFRAALLATGIGAIVILITSLITSLGSFTSSTKSAKEEQDLLNKSIEEGNEILDKNASKIKREGDLRISELKKNSATEAEIYKEQRATDIKLKDEYLEDLRKKNKIYEEQNFKFGKSTDEKIKENLDKLNKDLEQSRQRYQQQRLKIQIDANSEEERINKLATQKIKDNADKLKQIKDQELKELLNGQKEVMLKLLSEREQEEFKVNEHYSSLLFIATKYKQDTTQIKAAQAKELLQIDETYRKKEIEINQISINAAIETAEYNRKLNEKYAAEERELKFQRIENLISDLDYENNLVEDDFKADQERLIQKAGLLKEERDIELSNIELTAKERIDIISKYAKAERDIDADITASKKAEQQAKVELQLQYLGFAEQAGNLLGQIAGKNKALAIAGLLIEKGAAIAKIVTTMNTITPFLPVLGIPNPAFIPSRIAGALSIASVIAASAQGIQQINSASSGGSGGGMPSISAQAPMIPQAPQAQVTQLNQQSINDIGNQAVRAYVIESDVTSNQQRIAAIRQRARFS